MAAATDNLNIPERCDPSAFKHEAVAGSSAEYYKGAMIAIDVDATGSPFVRATAGDLSLRVVGRCEDRLTTGASNTKRLVVKSGIFRYASGATFEAIDAQDVGKVCYVIDDQTVGISGATGANAVAGRIYAVDASGVWVKFDPWDAPAKGATAGA